MSDSLTRARLIGALVLVAAFGAGVAVGYYLPRRPQEGVMITVSQTTRIPKELEDLDLSDSQRVQVQRLLHAGTERVGRVVRGFMVPMDAAIDSTDREIRAVLTEAQNRMLDEIRKERPLKKMKEKRVIDTAR